MCHDRAVRVRLIGAGGRRGPGYCRTTHPAPAQATEVQQLTWPRPADLQTSTPRQIPDEICFSSVLTEISVDKPCVLSVCLFCLGVVRTCLASYFSFSSRASTDWSVLTPREDHQENIYTSVRTSQSWLGCFRLAR